MFKQYLIDQRSQTKHRMCCNFLMLILGCRCTIPTSVSSQEGIVFTLLADMSSGLRTKVFEGCIMPLVQRWIADNPLRWHDRTLDFHRWWQIIMGYSLADASTRETEPDYRIVLEAGVRRVLKHSGFRSRCLDFTTYLWTSQDHVSTKSYIETVA